MQNMCDKPHTWTTHTQPGEQRTILLIIIVSFGLSFHIAFGHVSRSYMDFPEALFTLFKSTMGQFTIRGETKVVEVGGIGL